MKQLSALFIIACFAKAIDREEFYLKQGDDSFVISAELFQLCKTKRITSVTFGLSKPKGTPYEYDGKKGVTTSNKYTPSGELVLSELDNLDLEMEVITRKASIHKATKELQL